MPLLYPPSDHFTLNGYSHRCECGDIWYDSDGGPCHQPCDECGKLTDSDELNDGGICAYCIDKIAQEKIDEEIAEMLEQF